MNVIKPCKMDSKENCIDFILRTKHENVEINGYLQPLLFEICTKKYLLKIYVEEKINFD